MSNRIKKSDNRAQFEIPFDSSVGPLGDFAQEARLRCAITQAIRSCQLSRQQIAERVSQRLGERITEDMLYAITSDSHKQHRPPAMWVGAISAVTGSDLPLKILCEIFGGIFVSSQDQIFLEIGRAEAEKHKIVKKTDQLKEKAQEKI